MNEFASLGKQPPKTSLRNVRQTAAASLQNEQITRHRVEQLEAWAGAVGPSVEALQQATADHMDFISMGFLDRLRWLCRGTVPTRPTSVSVTKLP